MVSVGTRGTVFGRWDGFVRALGRTVPAGIRRIVPWFLGFLVAVGRLGRLGRFFGEEGRRREMENVHALTALRRVLVGFGAGVAITQRDTDRQPPARLVDRSEVARLVQPLVQRPGGHGESA